MNLIATNNSTATDPPATVGNLGATLETQQMESFEYNRKLIELFNQFQEAEDKQLPENPEHRIPEEFRNLSDYQVSSRKQLAKKQNRISIPTEETTKEEEECKEAN